MNEEDMTGFELGGIEIRADEKQFILTDKKYYFMVFVSISELLDKINSYYKLKKTRLRVNFADSSFYMDINRVNSDIIGIHIMKKFFGEFEEKVFVQKIYEASNIFYKNSLDESHPIVKDIECSLEDMLSVMDENY